MGGGGGTNGDPSHLPPSPVADSTWGHEKWWIQANPPLGRGDQIRVCSAEGGHVTCANPLFLRQFLNEQFLQESFFHKIDAVTSYLGDSSVKSHLLLRGGPWRQIRHSYSELEVIKACGEGGNSLSRRNFIPEATSPVRVVIKNKNKANHSSS